MNEDQILNEKIDVVAVFRPGRTLCEPVKFKRANGREVTVSEIGLGFPQPRGTRMVHVFDVTDGGTDYRLEFDAERLAWRLVRESGRE